MPSPLLPSAVPPIALSINRKYYNQLLKIKGIGPSKAKALLLHFGSLEALKNASKEDIIKVKGVNEANADEIIKYFNQ